MAFRWLLSTQKKRLLAQTHGTLFGQHKSSNWIQNWNWILQGIEAAAWRKREDLRLLEPEGPGKVLQFCWLVRGFPCYRCGLPSLSPKGSGCKGGCSFTKSFILAFVSCPAGKRMEIIWRYLFQRKAQKKVLLHLHGLTELKDALVLMQNFTKVMPVGLS